METLPCFLAALAVLLCPGHASPTQTPEGQDLMRLLEERIERLETANTQEKAKIYDLELVASQQKTRMAEIGELDSQQKAKIAELVELASQQNAKLSELEALVRKLEGEVRGGRDVMMSHEGAGVRVRRGVSEQSDVIRNQTGPRDNFGSFAIHPDTGRIHVDHVVAFQVGQLTQQVSALTAKFAAFESSAGQQKLQLDQKIEVMGSRLSALNASQIDQVTAIADAARSTYTQWGSGNCTADSSELVYSGVLGGSHYSHTGAATNYLCMTLNPSLSERAPPSDGIAFLYGGEYETYDKHQNKDPVCAVCRASFPTTVMVPGTNKCENGWQLQYSGYLMAGHHAHVAGSEFVCVDSGLKSNDRSSANENGILFYFTRSVCGSLPCDPYVGDKVVTCAVCSK